MMGIIVFMMMESFYRRNMFKKKRKKRKKLIIIVLSFIIILILFVLFNRSSDYNIVEKGIKGVVNGFYNSIVTPFFKSNDDKLLNDAFIESLETEINDLKNILNLNQTLSEYSIINATVINRNVNYWSNSITINKGSSDGIDIDMIVIDNNGLLGKVIKTTSKSSEIKLLTSVNDGFQISAGINNIAYGMISSYSNQLFLLEGINKYDDVKVDDIVTTSGLGGVFPKGIYIGEVEAIETANNGVDLNIYVKANTNYNHIYYVTVLGGVKE